MELRRGERPPVSFMPIIVNALDPNNNDQQAAAFRNAIPAALRDAIRQGWGRMSIADRGRVLRVSRSFVMPSGTFHQQILSQAKAYRAAVDSTRVRRRELVRREFDRFVAEGPARFVLSPTLVKNRTAALDFWRYWYCKVQCPCDEHSQEEQPVDPPDQPRYGVKLTKVKCYDQREVGNDEIYFVTVAVDGAGAVVSRISSKYSIDDDGDTTRYPNHYIYPVADPQGFLDIGVQLREDDGGYGAAGQAVAAIGGALATIPNPWTVGAGVGLAIIGETISLLSMLDSDDDYGDATLSWTSATALAGGAGSYVKTFYEADDGWFDDGHDFRATFKLIAVP